MKSERVDGESEAVTTRQTITSKGRAAGAQAKETSPPRVIIEAVGPEIDHGRFPIKRTVGEDVVVSADAFAEGHDVIAVVLRHRLTSDDEWAEVPMSPLGNDCWTARFTVTRQGRHEYTI